MVLTVTSARAACARFISCSVAPGTVGERPRPFGEIASLDYGELESQVTAISLSRPGVVRDLDVEKPFLGHHVSHDLLEATQRLAFQGPPEAKVSAIFPEPFVQFAPSGPGQKDLVGANDLDARNDVVSLHRYAMNATQLAILLATRHDGGSEEQAS
jgi:hypothetical protein